MAPPVFELIKLVFNPDVSKKLILQIAYQQISAIGVWKVLAFLLSSSIVGISSIIKIPQIKRIVKQNNLEAKVKVVEGLSLKSINLELLTQLIHWSYNARNKNMFITYGESILLGIQNLVIEFLIHYYRLKAELEEEDLLSDKQRQNKLLKGLVKPLLINLATLITVLKLLPDDTLSVLQILNIPLGIVSKVPQILRNHELRSTKHLSPIPIVANTLGSAIRIFTTIQMKGGTLLLVGYSSSFLLNAVLAGQCYFYSKDEPKEGENNSKKGERYEKDEKV
ncbi:uncharacterized protein PRCAT00006301001 [Priceomyces carsonii]|uniref:uncharacterized protein n=1 Tax=Priceomyces carsonii TaxID=28549 RepID=UPI002EDAD567|nr:unnamed protein product [Priceomyces carsonii]